MLEQVALACATKYFEDDSKEGLAQLTAAALLQKFSINTKGKNSNAMLAEMLKACVTRGINIPSGELGIWYCHTAIGAVLKQGSSQ